MTSANGFIDRTARHAGKLPLPRIVATMLGAAGAFFCFAMPQQVLDGFLGTFGVPAPVGSAGRVLFLLVFTALLAGLGWLVVTVAGGAGTAVDLEPDLDMTPAKARRRSFGSTDTVTASAAASAPIAVRRGDAHPDAPPRRPIFADHDLAPLEGKLPPADIDRAEDAEFHPIAEPEAEVVVEPEAQAGAEPEAEIVTDPIEDKLPDTVAAPAEEIVPVEAAPAPAADLVEEEAAITAPAETKPVEEPFDLTEALPVDRDPDPAEAEAKPVSAEIVPLQIDTPQAAVEPEPAPPAAEAPPAAPVPALAPSTADRSIGELMARLETGLDRRAGDLPPPPGATTTKSPGEPQIAPEEALRQALEALQRMAARQR